MPIVFKVFPFQGKTLLYFFWLLLLFFRRELTFSFQDLRHFIICQFNRFNFTTFRLRLLSDTFCRYGVIYHAFIFLFREFIIFFFTYLIFNNFNMIKNTCLCTSLSLITKIFHIEGVIALWNFNNFSRFRTGSAINIKLSLNDRACKIEPKYTKFQGQRSRSLVKNWVWKLVIFRFFAYILKGVNNFNNM